MNQAGSTLLEVPVRKKQNPKIPSCTEEAADHNSNGTENSKPLVLWSEDPLHRT
jgi:hypothetical protein